jgi:hypothetical protein
MNLRHQHAAIGHSTLPLPVKPRYMVMVSLLFSLILQLGADYLECAYGLRYVTLNHTRDRSKESWSIRQFAVYQKFSSVKGSIVWIFIAIPKEMEPCIDSYLSKCSSAAAENPFAMHLILIENALAGWRWYLVDLNQRVQTQVISPLPKANSG